MHLTSDQGVRDLFEPSSLATMDALSGGRLAGVPLRLAARAMLDFRTLLGDADKRDAMLRHLPSLKKRELAERVGHELFNGTANWNPGSVRALYDFFGLFDDRPSPHFPVPLDIAEPVYGLFDYQRRAVDQLLPLLENGHRRAVLHLPTGAGKTRTAMHVVAYWLRQAEPSVVVWLASSDELLAQARTAFADAWSHLGNRSIKIGAMWGSQMPDLDAFDDGFLAIGLQKGWAVMSRNSEWLGRLSGRVRLVVFDEAHQCIAATYRWITDELTVDYRCSLLGLTATPGRTWADIDRDGELARYFAESKVTLDVPGDNPIQYLTDKGYLARATFTKLSAERDEDNRSSRNGHPADNSSSERYLTAVLDAIEAFLDAAKRRLLVFAASVEQAKLLAGILAARGKRCEVVTAQTPSDRRRRVIRDFTTPTTDSMVILNYGVLTTGFDAPGIDAVVIARPTLSLVLYSQMVGRALRGPKAGGTKDCAIVTVVDPNLPGFGDIAEAFLNWEDVWTTAI